MNTNLPSDYPQGRLFSSILSLDDVRLIAEALVHGVLDVKQGNTSVTMPLKLILPEATASIAMGVDMAVTEDGLDLVCRVLHILREQSLAELVLQLQPQAVHSRAAAVLPEVQRPVQLLEVLKVANVLL